jgi:hypothetical protein
MIFQKSCRIPAKQNFIIPLAAVSPHILITMSKKSLLLQPTSRFIRRKGWEKTGLYWRIDYPAVEDCPSSHYPLG